MSEPLPEERIPLGYELLAVVTTEAEAQIICSGLRDPFYAPCAGGGYRVYQQQSAAWPCLTPAATWLDCHK